MELLPHAKYFRYGAIALLAIIFFFPSWLPFGLGTRGAVPLLLLTFLIIILSFLQYNRIEKISEAYLAHAKRKMKGEDYLKHLKALASLLEEKMKNVKDDQTVKKDLERRFKLVRRELARINQ